MCRHIRKEATKTGSENQVVVSAMIWWESVIKVYTGWGETVKVCTNGQFYPKRYEASFNGRIPPAPLGAWITGCPLGIHFYKKNL